MKLVGELKEKVGKTEDLTEAKNLIENAGMQLTDEEMNQVAGGITEEEVNAQLKQIKQEKEQYRQTVRNWRR